MSDLLEVDSIRKSFGNNQVLTDIYLRCETGDIIGLLGRNGSGKSTLMKIIFGSLHTDYKHIKVNNILLSQPFKTKNQIAYLAQDSFLPKNLTVRQVVNLYSKNSTNRNILDDEIITKVVDNRVRFLSGGEARYLEIRLILELDTKFILLDEPFNGVSPLHVDLIKKMIIQKSQHKGIILTDHDYRNVLDVANKYFILYDGGLKHVKSKDDIVYWGYLPESQLIQ